MYFKQDKHKLKCGCIINFIFSKFRSTGQNHSFNCRGDFHSLVETPCSRIKSGEYFFCLLGCPPGVRPVINSVFGRLCRKTYSRGREDMRSGTDKLCSLKWSHTIFPCTDPYTNIFCISPLLPQKTQKALRIKKAICVVWSDLIIGVTLEVLS